MHRIEAWSEAIDVLVVGGGSAGIGAAIGAAQAGARVVLVEHYGFLGGAATQSGVHTLCGFFDRTGEQVVGGVGQQVLHKLDAQGALATVRMPESGNTVIPLDVETTKRVYDEVVLEAGVRLLLHAHVVSVAMDGSRVSDVTVHHRGGLLRIRAAVVVDASGDGVVLDQCGVAQVESDATRRQASTLVMHVGGVKEHAPLASADLRHAISSYGARHRVDFPRQSGMAVREPASGEVMLLLADSRLDVLDPEQHTRAEVESRSLAAEYAAALRDLPGWADSYLAQTGPQLGVRESRRLRGIEPVVAADALTGCRRPDAIARCGWPIESHVEPGRTRYVSIKDDGWYHIGIDALRSAEVANVYAAGRLTASDPGAYASLRVMGTSFATGHAAGVAAALHATGPAEPKTGDVQAELLRQGALL